MVMAIRSILRSIQRAQKVDIDKLNILTICQNNEKYIAILCQTQHNFYILNEHPWNSSIEIKPPNISTFDVYSKPLDYIICHDRAEQYEQAEKLSRELHVPIIIVDMCSKALIRPHHILEEMNPINLDILNRNVPIHVCSSEYIEQSWHNNNNVSINAPIGIDINRFKNNQSSDKPIVCIDNNTVPQVGTVIEKILTNSYKILATDHNNLDDISVNKSRYFINTNKTITVKVLEAMAAENVVISLKTQDTENFIKHQETGMLINNIEEIVPTIKLLEKPNSIREHIVEQARNKIIKEHSMEKFLTQWSLAFNMIQSIFYNPSI